MEVALWTYKILKFKICFALIARQFQFFFFFFWFIVQFYTLNLILFHFNCNIEKCQPSLANLFTLFLLFKVTINAVFAWCCET